MKIIKLIALVAILLFGVQNQMANAQELQERQMTIQQLAEQLEANNIQLDLAETSVEIAEAKIGEAKINRLPDISADMSGLYLSDVSIYDTDFSKVQTVDLPNFGHQFNVNVNQLLYAGGQVNKSIQLAKMNKTLSENQREDTEQSVKLNATQLYLNLYNLQNQKKILEENKKLAHERTKTAQQYFDENMITKNELLRAEVLERQLEQSIIQVENAIEIANKNLKLFAGIEEDILIVPDISNLNHEIRSQDEVFYRQKAFDNNPKILTSQNQIDIAEKSLELTKTEQLPVLAAFAGYNSKRPMTSGTPADLYSNTYQVGLSLSYNIGSLYKNKKKAAVDRIMIKKAEQGKEAIRQQIEADVNEAYKNYTQSVAQKKVSLINEEAADENYRITELKYKNQLVTYIEIIDASNTKLDAELQTLDDQTAIILNYVKLLRVTGQL